MIEYSNLLEKGFTKKEAQKTIEIIERAKEKKTPKIRFLDSFIYWMLLIVSIIGNLVMSITLIPFLLAFKKIPLYFIIIILAAMFGFLFDQLIKDIENLEHQHYIIAWIFIPALALINIYYITSFTNHVTEIFKLEISINPPLLISVIYVIAFILPYLIGKLIENSISTNSFK